MTVYQDKYRGAFAAKSLRTQYPYCGQSPRVIGLTRVVLVDTQARSHGDFFVMGMTRFARFVYFVLDEQTGLIKIGTCSGLTTRLRSLKKQNKGGPLRLLGWVSGGREDEKQMHARFAEHCAHHEWFYPVPEILSFIAAHTTKENPERSKHKPSEYRNLVVKKETKESVLRICDKLQMPIDDLILRALEAYLDE
jgi:hypothetical protein